MMRPSVPLGLPRLPEPNTHTMTQAMTATKKVLHVGCGPRNAAPLDPTFATDQWQEIRLDIDPEAEPDIEASITEMSMVQSNSMDGLFSSHNIEHLYSHEVPVALGEFHRVLKPSGLAIISCPDIQRVAEHVAKGNLEGILYTSPAGPIAALDMIYGFRNAVAGGKLAWSHKTGFTRDTLGNKLVQVGFSKVQVARSGYQLVAQVVK